MSAKTNAFLALSFSIGTLAPVATFAGDAAKVSSLQIAEDRSKAEVANALVIWGRATKDPDMLMVAARLLSGIKGDVADSKASSADKPVYYDIAKIADEAKALPANRTELPPREKNAGFCHYEYLCDSLSCSYQWVC